MDITFLITFLILELADCEAKPKAFNETRPSSRYDNPNFIRDRYHDEIWKPMLTEDWTNRFRKPFHPAWMDYCDPYHCNDYHKTACGLNRRTMRFKWFQSQCHMILNNLCATYRGSLKYDLIDTKFCYQYVMHLRNSCSADCPDDLEPACAISNVDNHVVLFKNECAFNRANCNSGILEEYEKIDMKICINVLNV